MNMDLQTSLFFLLKGITSLTADFIAVGLRVNTMYSPGVITGKIIYASREE